MTDDLIVATNPGEMMVCQENLVKWCDGRLTVLATELKTATENFAAAQRAKWRSAPWKRVVDRTRRRIAYYEKVKTALLAGYYIIPPFPAQTIAIRTNRRHPDAKASTSWNATHSQGPKLLPPGEGRYVSPDPEVWTQLLGKDAKGNDVTQHFAKEFRPVDFPFTMVRPEIIDATNKAMTRKIFDRIGVLPAINNARSRDPIIVGNIDWPEHPGYGERRTMAFFIAWWLPLEGF